MDIIEIISEHTKRNGHNVYSVHPPHSITGTLGPSRGKSFTPPARGMRRVQAIVRVFGITCTRHIDI